MKYFLYIIAIFLFISCENSKKNDTSNNDEPIENNNTLIENNTSKYPKRDITPITINFKSTNAQNNKAAYITSQCYTKTVDEEGNIHNPCFSCHINSKEPNYINDYTLQETYDFGEYSKTNRFKNLFKDRTELINQISNNEIIDYIRESNYIKNDTLILAKKLEIVPKEWDINGNGKWDGYMPDCYFNFDNEGFDKTPDGNLTGWRSFAYYPFLGTFWPTNGSTDDVLIRLPKEFRENINQEFDLEVYKLNLSIVEALIKQKNISINEVNEKKYDVDLNQNGKLDIAKEIVFKWEKPSYNSSTGKIENFSMQYVGYSKSLLKTNSYLIAPKLYPKGTEFLHTVRYIDIDDNNKTIKMAKRLKELRYGKKTNWLSYSELSNAVNSEIKEKNDFPNRLRTIIGNSEQGSLNNIGWVYQGFIEDANGDLRPQNYEENLYCIGCHSGIGAIEDSTFVFKRKFDNSHFQKGWYHWSQKRNALKGIKEPKTIDNRNEYSLYLQENHAGDEFRENSEIIEKFFNKDGFIKENELNKIHNDISYLLYPSIKRALELNKAYKIIVEEQSFIYGRDTHIKPVKNVYKEVEIGETTKVNSIQY